MQKLFKTTLLFLMLISLFSCDPETNYLKEIQNDTDQEIKIYLTGDGALFNADSIFVAPNSSTEYYNTYSLGRNKSFDCDPRIATMDHTVEVANGKTLIKDITKADNWNGETDKKNTYWKCTFIINEADLE